MENEINKLMSLEIVIREMEKKISTYLDDITRLR